MLNWEGGWHGQHKIQQVIPLLHIKRSNVDWQTITLRQLYQHETIQILLDDCMKEEQNENQTSRHMEGALKVYGSRQMAEEPYILLNRLLQFWTTRMYCIYHIVPLVELIQHDHLLT